MLEQEQASEKDHDIVLRDLVLKYETDFFTNRTIALRLETPKTLPPL